MDLVLAAGYLFILAAEIYWLILAIRRFNVRGWMILFSAELLSCVSAAAIARYYDNLPGYGFMPGLTYFAEAILSYGAAWAYGIIFCLSAAAAPIVHLCRKRSR